MELYEIGQKLKEARENKGLTAHDIHERLKISVLVVEAMESGDEDNLPHPVYTKGFYQEYIRLLGLNWDEFADRIDMLDESADEFDESGELPTSLQVSSKPGKSSYVLKAGAGILLLGLAAFFVWFMISSFMDSDSNLKDDIVASKKDDGPERYANDTRESEKIASEFADPQGAQNASREVHPPESATMADNASTQKTAETPPDSVADPTPGENEADLGRENGTEQRAVQDPVETDAEAEKQSESSEAMLGANSSFPADESVRIMTVTANDDCWMSAELDGKKREFYLRSGDSVNLGFDESLRLRLGNSGGVSLTLDGREYPFEGAANEVRTITVGLDE